MKLLCTLNVNRGVLNFLQIYQKRKDCLLEFTCTASVCSWSKRVYTSQDFVRVANMNLKSTPKVKLKRKKKRAQRKDFADANEEMEGIVYETGLF